MNFCTSEIRGSAKRYEKCGSSLVPRPLLDKSSVAMKLKRTHEN